ncbi:MAG: S8 family serine peptidase [Burkholderiaceae bacterium]|nr:S8 family serine peptidase [Burkholderiaceae bacterium]
MHIALGKNVQAVVGLVCMAFVAVQAHAGERLARGLIVQFKDAPAHQDAAPATRGSGESELARVRRVLVAAGLSNARLRAVGRAAQRVDMGHLLGEREAARLAARLRARPEVEWVVPNEIEQRLQVPNVPNDPRFVDGNQWWLKSVSGSDTNALADRLRGVPGFQTAWTFVKGSPTAVVAVLDTGITAHQDLDANVLPNSGYDFVSTVEYAKDGDGRDGDPSDEGDGVTRADITNNPALFSLCKEENSSWHGTSTAGIVAAVTDNGKNIAAASWNGRVLPVRVAGKCGAEVADIIAGMRWAAGLHVDGVPDNPPAHWARVVNISFGGGAPCNKAYQDAIDELSARGVVVVAAAGNEHVAPTRPANCNGVLGVTALNRDGFKATYSNFGAKVAIATVGGDPTAVNVRKGDGIWGPFLGDSGITTIGNSGVQDPGNAVERQRFGTSFSAPIVAGVVSLMFSANPNLTTAQVITGLRVTARPHVTSPEIGLCSNANPGRCICTTSTCGAGILDAAEAVRYAEDLRDGVVFMPVNWPTVVIDNGDVDAAVALGQDLPANVIPRTSSGGGALDLRWLLALALSVGGVAWVGRQRV